MQWQGAVDLVVRCFVHPGQYLPSYEVRRRQHPAQKRLREMKGVSWFLRCQKSQEATENRVHKPLAYSSTTDVVDGIIPDKVLTVG